MNSTALLTDHYELTMLEGALRSGAAHRRSVFEVFARRLPDGRRYGVAAGTGRLLDALEEFRFDTAICDFLHESGIVDESTRDWLAGYRFTGDVFGYAEGECYFPGSPLLIVESTFAEAVLLETLVLSVLNHDSAIASAASRMTSAAMGRPCLEMGSRRTHEEAAVAAARAAYLAGFSASSNLEARRRFGVPTTGTSAHAFVLLHDSEREAFSVQVEALGRGTTLLVDTYDVAEAVKIAVEVAGPELGAVRLDSGDLLWMAHRVRKQLDELGAEHDQDRGHLGPGRVPDRGARPRPRWTPTAWAPSWSPAPARRPPAWSTSWWRAARAPRPDAPMVPVAKKSSEKATRGGRKYAWRRIGSDGVAQEEVVGTGAVPEALKAEGRDLLMQYVAKGEVIARPSLAEIRERHEASRAELPPWSTQLSRGEPAIPTVYPS